MRNLLFTLILSMLFAGPAYGFAAGSLGQAGAAASTPTVTEAANKLQNEIDDKAQQTRNAQGRNVASPKEAEEDKVCDQLAVKFKQCAADAEKEIGALTRASQLADLLKGDKAGHCNVITKARNEAADRATKYAEAAKRCRDKAKDRPSFINFSTGKGRKAPGAMHQCTRLNEKRTLEIATRIRELEGKAEIARAQNAELEEPQRQACTTGSFSAQKFGEEYKEVERRKEEDLREEYENDFGKQAPNPWDQPTVNREPNPWEQREWMNSPPEQFLRDSPGSFGNGSSTAGTGGDSYPSDSANNNHDGYSGGDYKSGGSDDAVHASTGNNGNNDGSGFDSGFDNRQNSLSDSTPNLPNQTGHDPGAAQFAQNPLAGGQPLPPTAQQTAGLGENNPEYQVAAYQPEPPKEDIWAKSDLWNNDPTTADLEKAAIGDTSLDSLENSLNGSNGSSMKASFFKDPMQEEPTAKDCDIEACTEEELLVYEENQSEVEDEGFFASMKSSFMKAFGFDDEEEEENEDYEEEFNQYAKQAKPKDLVYEPSDEVEGWDEEAQKMTAEEKRKRFAEHGIEDPLLAAGLNSQLAEQAGETGLENPELAKALFNGYNKQEEDPLLESEVMLGSENPSEVLNYDTDHMQLYEQDKKTGTMRPAEVPVQDHPSIPKLPNQAANYQ